MQNQDAIYCKKRFLKGRIPLPSTDIQIKSITYAMKGQQILERHGMSAYVARDHDIKSGCGYKLIIYGDRNAAINLLKTNGVKLSGER